MKKFKKAVIAGGSGFMGRRFIHHCSGLFEEITVLSRSKMTDYKNVHFELWDGKTPGSWTRELEGADLVLNLSGKSVDCRYNSKNKKEIFDSRTDSTTALGTAVIMAARAPKLWINAASATIYRHAQDRPMTEENGEIGSGFSVEVCKKWEETFWSIPTPETRKVVLRTALVLGNEGGVFERLSDLTRWGLGGRQGSGKQMMSWIHEIDFCRIVLFLMQHQNLEGTFNAAAPTPLKNADFMAEVRNALKVRFGLPANRWMIEIGTFLLRTESELILKSRWVLQEKLSGAGFHFQFETLGDALRQLADSRSENVAMSPVKEQIKVFGQIN